MDSRQAYSEKLEEQLQVLEGQIQGVREKMALATGDGKEKMSELVERWTESSTAARRKLVELRQEGEPWEEKKDGIDRTWEELKALVDSAKEAF